jgi:DNA-binding response OmpR family regulator
MRIAVADDDDDLINFVRGVMLRSGHSCACFRTGTSLLAGLRRETFDLILLDWNLPDASGFDLLRQIRATLSGPIGIIMLTSRSDKDDIAGALHAGADDYIVKPESAGVIAARVEAVLRRAVPGAPDERLVRFDGYLFDRLTETITIGTESIPLSNKEFALALLFFENPHRAMSRGYLLETIWQSVSDLPTRTLDMHVSKIRTKLHLRPEKGYRIVALSGYGYRMERFPAGDDA